MKVGNFNATLAPLRVRDNKPSRRRFLRTDCMTLATDQNSDGHGLSPTALRFVAIRDAVMDHWEREVRARVDGARHLLRPVLTNTLPAFFDNIAEALSPDHPREQGTSSTNAASAHGNERARMTPFGPDQVVHEYQILRESIAVVARGRVARDNRDRSHDMRTPLSVVANGAQLLARTDDWALVRKVAAKVQSNADRLEDMMASLLDALTFQGAARIPLHLTRFDILDLAQETHAQYIPADGGAVAIDVAGEPVTGYWCRASLRRALENLINNAIKYGDHGTVSILARQTRGRLMLSVHNQGNPIPEEQHERIFDYLRREAGPLAATGWGIGLPFVKAVGEGHGGSVTVDSSPALGTTFLIDIPVDCRPFVEQDGGRRAVS
ncbi:MAG: HAMP domain-containing histidine kinase [Oxalobacteraceae bacterium]|nr:MAG: HAMP domain-containing histidine kinase [Oxalobacteraceae bacterium]